MVGNGRQDAWQSWRRWEFRMCKLQIRLAVSGFESHPLRQIIGFVSFRLAAIDFPSGFLRPFVPRAETPSQASHSEDELRSGTYPGFDF